MKFLHISILLIITLFIKSVTYSQISQEVWNQLSDKNPEFIGGDTAYKKFLAKELVYPNITDRDKRIASVRVISQFVVEKDGKLSNFSFDCDFEILGEYSQEDYDEISELYSAFYQTSMKNFLLKMPRWKPAEYKGEKVSVIYGLPVVFRYDDAVAPEKETEVLFTVVDEMPEFPGGDVAKFKFLATHIKYPVEAKEKKIQGTVYVSFVIDEEGTVTEVKVVKGIGYGCDEEAIRVVKLMPKWKPAKQKGKPVKIQQSLPIKFSLN